MCVCQGGAQTETETYVFDHSKTRSYLGLVKGKKNHKHVLKSCCSCKRTRMSNHTRGGTHIKTAQSIFAHNTS